jgi:hypothetical protein
MAQGMQGVCLGYLKNTVFETRQKMVYRIPFSGLFFHWHAYPFPKPRSKKS